MSDPAQVVFPHILLRLAAGPFDDVRSTSVGLTREVAALEGRDRGIAALRAELSDLLYTRVGQATSSDDRWFLIHLRRDIHNGRSVSVERRARARALLPEPVLARLEQLREAEEERCRASSELERTYARTLARVRGRLQRLASSEKLRRGLTLSSPGLLARLDEYVRADPERLTAKQAKIERGLIKYIFRMYLKASPLSTFTHVCVGAVADDPVPYRFHAGSAYPGQVRLNGYILRYIRDWLGVSRRTRECLSVAVNPSLRRADDGYRVFINSSNAEAFQHIASHPALDWLLRTISALGGAVPYTRLLDALADAPEFEATRADATMFIDRLLAIGCLEFRIPVSGTDPRWPERLVEWIGRDLQPSGLAGRIAERFADVQSAARAWGAAPPESRSQILSAIRESVSDLRAMLIDGAGGPATSDSALDPDVFRCRVAKDIRVEEWRLVYEDTTCDATLSVGRRHLEGVVQALASLARELAPLDVRRAQRGRIRAFYLQRFGGRAQVELLEFYEAYCRAQDGGTPLPAPDTTGGPRGLDRLAERVRDCPAGRDVLDLRAGDFAGRVLADGSSADATPNAYSCLVQFFAGRDERGDEELHAVLPHPALNPGHGKAYSRFLYLLDPGVTQDLIRWNASLLAVGRPTENADASVFNANLHPPILPWEIRVPGGESALPPDRQIPITELCITQRDGDVALVHGPTRDRVQIFNLGFQGRGRSRLFRFLNSFTTSPTIPCVDVLDRLNEASRGGGRDADGGGAGLRRFPRIVYERRVVLQRRRWVIAREALPDLASATGWQGFARAQGMRERFGLPQRVFMRVASSADANQRVESRRDDTKPFYLDFTDPLLVQLLPRVLRRVATGLIVEEMLPDADQLLRSDRARYVTECVVQWREGRGPA